MSAYLIHWTSTRSGDLTRGADAIMSAQRVDSEAELVGFLLNLPGDGSFIVRAVTAV